MRRFFYLFFTVTVLFTCSSAFTQTYVTLKAMNGTTKLNGGSTVTGHTGEIDILSYSQGQSYCLTCNRANFSDLSVMMVLNPATITLKQLLVNGTKLTSIDLTYRQGTVDYYKIHMENVVITSMQESGSNERPDFSVSFNADRIAWQNTVIKSDGTAGAKSSYGWDILNNVEWLYY